MSTVKKPHKHAELIKAWAEGEVVQIRNYGTGTWTDRDNPSWSCEDDYRVKPREFPRSGMSDADLGATWRQAEQELTHNTDRMIEAFRYIADAAVKQYILDLEKEAANGF